jgi:hypothetical protein
MTNRGVDVVWLSRSVAPRASLMRFRPTALWSRASGRRSSRLNQRVERSAVTTSRAVIPVPPGATSPSTRFEAASARGSLRSCAATPRARCARRPLGAGGIGKRRRGDREQERSPYAPGEVGTAVQAGEPLAVTAAPHAAREPLATRDDFRSSSLATTSRPRRIRQIHALGSIAVSPSTRKLERASSRTDRRRRHLRLDPASARTGRLCEPTTDIGA